MMAHGHGGKRAGAGRPRGSTDYMTKELKDTILEALEKSHENGSLGYLVDVAKKDHKTFCGLLGRVLPMTVGGDQEHPLSTITTIRLVAGSSERSREDDA
jgi:hypothetical protein